MTCRRLTWALALVLALGGTARAAGEAEELKRAGDALAAEGRRDEALERYEAAIAADPDHLPAYEAAAPLWFAAQRFDAAIERLEPLVRRKPTYALGWYHLAFAYRKSERHEDAVRAYRKFIALEPKEPDPWFGLGMTYKAMGRRDDAIAAFETYVKLEKREAKRKFVDQARAELETLRAARAAKGRDAAEAKKREGDARRDAGDLVGAEARYREAIAADPTLAAAHNELGAVLFAQRRVEDAIVAFERAVELDPKDATAWYNLAHARRKAGRHAAAVDAYRAYVALEPANPDPYYGLGHSLRALGDHQGARAAFARYVELETRESERRWVERAEQEIAAIDAEQASGAATADAAAGKSPLPTPTREEAAEARVFLERGDQQFAAKQYEEAAGSYRAACALDPGHADARYRLGVALAAQGDLAAAIGAWEQVLLVQPTHDRSRRNIELARRKLERSGARPSVDEAEVLDRARDLVQKGRGASALLALDDLLADPRYARHAGALALRAEARLAAGDARGAIADWEVVLALEPSSAAAARGLGDAWRAAGDAARAKYYYELFLRRAPDDPAAAVVRQTLRTM